MQNLDQFYLNRWSQNENWSKIGPTKKKRLFNLSLIVNKYFRENKNIKCIDYGCGSGWLFHYLYEMGFENLYGFDVTPSSLKIVQQKFPFIKRLWSVTDEFDQNIPTNYFELCISSEVYEHISFGDKKDYLKNINQLLTSDGYLYLTTPNGKYKKTGIKKSEHQPIEDWDKPYKIEKLLRESGFEILIKDSFYFRPHLSFTHKLLYNKKAVKLFTLFGIKSSIEKFNGKHMMGLSTYFFCKKIKSISE